MTTDRADRDRHGDQPRPRGRSAGDASHVTSDGLICLAPSDNVVIATRSIESGERFAVDGVEITVTEDVPIGYKLARRALRVGETVVRFAMPIGRMTAGADAGELVHTHNLASTYLPATSRARSAD